MSSLDTTDPRFSPGGVSIQYDFNFLLHRRFIPLKDRFAKKMIGDIILPCKMRLIRLKYYSWMQVPRIFAVLFAWTTFCRPKKVANQLEDKISSATFWCLFGILLEDKKRSHDLLPSFFEFWTPKSHQKDGKKSCDLFCPPLWSATKKGQQKVG